MQVKSSSLPPSNEILPQPCHSCATAAEAPCDLSPRPEKIFNGRNKSSPFKLIFGAKTVLRNWCYRSIRQFNKACSLTFPFRADLNSCRSVSNCKDIFKHIQANRHMHIGFLYSFQSYWSVTYLLLKWPQFLLEMCDFFILFRYIENTFVIFTCILMIFILKWQSVTLLFSIDLYFYLCCQLLQLSL